MKTLPSFLSLFSWSLARKTSSMSAFSRSSMTLRFPPASTLHHDHNHLRNSQKRNNSSSNSKKRKMRKKQFRSCATVRSVMVLSISSGSGRSNDNGNTTILAVMIKDTTSMITTVRAMVVAQLAAQGESFHPPQLLHHPSQYHCDYSSWRCMPVCSRPYPMQSCRPCASWHK